MINEKPKTKLMKGDNITSLKKLPDNSIDSIVTDPPYGLSFMGKKWDYDVPSVQFWKEVYRVLKPGGHIVSFGGTRTYHRMVVNIEDAGFEIRDQIMWLYGSGFPKSHNIGKAVDKLEGNEREVVGKIRPNGGGGVLLEGRSDSDAGMFSGKNKDVDKTKGSSEFEGWGTALKPSQEIVAVAQKPEDLEGTALNLIYIIKTELWKLYVNVVEQSSELNQVEQKEVLNTAQCLVEKNTNIQDALQGLMGMSQLRLMENMNWNTVLLWHNILEDLSQKMSRYTISTKSNLITDLKTLKSLEWQNILESITQVKNNQIDGLNVNVLTAVALFNVLNLKLKDIQQHSVQDRVIYKEEEMDCQNEPICLARKPLSEKSVAENVLKWKTGGINVDGCRVGSEVIQTQFGITKENLHKKYNDEAGSNSLYDENGIGEAHEGRFPANIILECCCDEVIKGEKGEVKKTTRIRKGEAAGGLDINENKKEVEGIDNYNDKGDIHTNPNCPCYVMDNQSGFSKSRSKYPEPSLDGLPMNHYETTKIKHTAGREQTKEFISDKGGASRFFYQAKVSKKERNMGLDGFEDKETKGSIGLHSVGGTPTKDNNRVQKNTHPTVKPVSLMAYLCRLITPKNGIVLDPFMGSGSTGIAAQLEGFRFVGMEMDADYFKIAESRIENYEKYREFLKK